MKVIEARFMTRLCAATASAPSPPAMKFEPAKAHISSDIWIAIGKPIARSARSPAPSNARRDHGTQAPSWSRKPSTSPTPAPNIAMRVRLVASPAPTRPSAGKPQ